MIETAYGFGVEISGASFDEAVATVTAALQKEGFGILTEIDVKQTLRKKLDVDFRRYLILGACNPPLAKQALDAEEDIGLLLPCNVVVQEAAPGTVRVSIANPLTMFTLVPSSAVEPVAREADRRLRRVRPQFKPSEFVTLKSISASGARDLRWREVTRSSGRMPAREQTTRVNATR